jgi:hypothetical protein
MKKISLLLFFVMILPIIDLSGRHMFNEEREQSNKKIVIEISLTNHTTVPPLTLFYNGLTTKNDRAGFAKFPAPQQLPKKWYLLLTQNCDPILAKNKKITGFRIPTNKTNKYAYYSCKWEEDKEEWIIKKKSLQAKNNILPKAEDTIIIKLSPTFVSTVKAPTCSRSCAETGAVILLPQIVLLEQKETKQLTQSVLKSSLPHGLHGFNKKIIEKKIINNEGKTSLYASYI